MTDQNPAHHAKASPTATAPDRAGGAASSGGSLGSGRHIVELRARLREAAREPGAAREVFDAFTRAARPLAGLDAAVLLSLGRGQIRVIAVDPAVDPEAAPPSWVKPVVELAREVDLSSGPVVRPLMVFDRPMGGGLVLAEVLRRGEETLVLAGPVASMEVPFERLVSLELAGGVLSEYEALAGFERAERRASALDECFAVQNAVGAHHRFKSAAMAMCNDICARFGAERVSLGLAAERYVRLKAMSQTEQINKKSDLVHAIEGVMEECLDQDREIYTPAPAGSTFINRAAREFSEARAGLAVCSFPLRAFGEVYGVLTVESRRENELSIEQAERLRLACDAVAPQLRELARHDRWLGSRIAAGGRRLLAAALGPEHTWAKAGAIALVGFLIFATLFRGDHRVESPFVVEPVERRIIPAPFDGFLREVHVEPGDRIVSGETVLAELETAELRLELAKQRAAFTQHMKDSDIARREGDEAKVRVERARADAAAAEIAWLEHKIAQARIVAPLDGLVLLGDLDQSLGAPVGRGDVLFELAPIEQLRAVLHVPDNRIDEVELGQRGTLATASHPGDKVGYTVEMIHPHSESIDGANVFRVRVRLDEPRPWLVPGVEGLSKTVVGRRVHLDIWTREAVNWVRMKLWI